MSGVGDFGTAPSDVAHDSPPAPSRIRRPSEQISQQPSPPAIVGCSAELGTNWYRESLTRSVSHLGIGQVVAEHDRQTRSGDGDLWHAVLPIVLAGATHHEQIAVTELP